MSSTNAQLPSSRIAVAAAVAGCLALATYRHYKQSRRRDVGNDEASPPSTPGGSARKKKKRKRKRTKKKKSSVSSDPIDPSTFQFPPRAKCSLCKVTLPLKQSQKTFLLCCGTEICRACNASAYAAGIPTKKESNNNSDDDEIDEIEEIEVDEDETKEELSMCCVLCNSEAPAGVENILNLLQLRIEEDQDPNAMHVLSGLYWDENGVENNPQKALELCTRAAEADHAEACHELALVYCEGKYGIAQDLDKGKLLLFKAARLGSAVSFNALGGLMIQEGNVQLGTRYWLLGASNGEEYALHNVKKAFEGKVISKEDYALALRAYQTAHGATRSPKRDEMEKGMAAMTNGN
mmetsp:Transcript_185/g.476  ORF Transcript_185/g.476 Transcript_185/m.476 type:complete len:350 (-) Transcript_185:97-1146(-)|eukprot:CAMPEP_0181061140 /NCGR_PEP_ID=MMETSP1070-20121207/22354_1 /TAXON_ID=265543 /ORGANISM="Minutocellus polymorphus, Strain NH13" /LENGTH=349 /DNA_ID=CAMNT_0023141059 /DNA_START=97 /DNA_END=1146 /DNA_ORIENTATION=+